MALTAFAKNRERLDHSIKDSCWQSQGKNSQFRKALPTQTSLLASSKKSNKNDKSLRTCETPADHFYSIHGALPRPSSMHATLPHTCDAPGAENILIIGDVHGCFDEMQLLYRKAVEQNDGKEFLFVILVGDLCNKGPDSVRVIKFVRETNRWLAVRGNHDDSALADALGLLKSKKYQWVSKSKDGESLSDDDVMWLSELPYTLRIPGKMLDSPFDTVIVHAGFMPDVPLKDQTIHNMITLREVVCQDGKKKPWASVWNGPFRVIFGHDARRGFQRYEHDWAIGLDTGACYGKKLTGIILPERRILSVDALKIHCSTEKNDND